MGRFSDTRVAKWLNEIDTVWLSMHHENPDLSSPVTSEISGGAYDRLEILFGAAQSRYITNITGGKYSGLPTSMVTHFGGWTSQHGGDFEFDIELETPKRLKLGQSLTINPGDLVLSIY